MTDAACPIPNSRASELSAMILQIDRPDEPAPLQFPALIRNLVAGVATLEVMNPWTILNWENLKGQSGCLRLLNQTGEITDLRGTITWAKYRILSQDSGNLSLNLELTDPDPIVQRQLIDCIPHPAKDVKGFWDRWDQAQAQPPKPSLIPTKLVCAALALLLSGLVLQLTGATGFILVGWALWGIGTTMVAYQALRFWRSRNASHLKPGQPLSRRGGNFDG